MEIDNGLEVCRKVGKMLKSQFPNDIMKIEKNTVIAYSKENSRLLSGNKDRRGGMGGCHAYYTNSKPHRIAVKQKVLINQDNCWCGANHYSVDPIMETYNSGTTVPKRSLNTSIRGNFALVELMCHEFAHHRTKGHAKGFKIKYKRHLDFMINKMISGEFYLD
jgi:hypothetical protein